MATPPLNLRPTTPPGSPSASNFSYETSPYLYLFTSLTAGSSHIITATSRLETILKANRIPFKAVDCATDEKARRIWSRRAGKRKLPGLVKQGVILADLELVEEWNEFGEIKDNLGDGAGSTQAPAQIPAQAPPQTTQPTDTAATTSADSSAKSPSATSQSTPTAGAAASSPTTGQTPQQQQQSLLAREAAAIGAQRSKPKSIPSAKAPSTTPAVTAAADADAASSSVEGTPRFHPRSPELDEDHDIDDHKHNTSSSAALPPLSIRTHNTSPPDLAAATVSLKADSGRARADTASSLTSPAMPSAPPPSAIEPTTSIDATLADKALAAGPARKAGLEAVTNDPAIAVATALSPASSAHSPTPTQTQIHRGSSVSPASPEEIKEIESRNSIQEVSDEDEDDDDDYDEDDPDADVEPASLNDTDDVDIDVDEDIVQTPHSPSHSSDETAEPELEPHLDPGAESPRIARAGARDKHITIQEPAPEAHVHDDAAAAAGAKILSRSRTPSPRVIIAGGDQLQQDKHIKFQEDVIKGDSQAAGKAGESVGD